MGLISRVSLANRVDCSKNGQPIAGRLAMGVWLSYIRRRDAGNGSLLLLVLYMLLRGRRSAATARPATAIDLRAFLAAAVFKLLYSCWRVRVYHCC